VSITDLPTLNTVLNAISAILLTLGFIQIKKGNIFNHKRLMLSAFGSSTLFLISYLIYHYQVGSVPYQGQGWSQILYFIILVPHIILAAVMVPFILAMIWLALTGHFDRHKKLARWVWPVWMYVSLSGIAVYLMLYVI